MIQETSLMVKKKGAGAGGLHTRTLKFLRFPLSFLEAFYTQRGGE